jgi:purine-binding chemotaxis protein CheW
MEENKKTEETEQILQLVSFNIGEEQFGVEILKVQEIIRMVNITQVPNSPSYVEGVINLRGRIIPIVDLRTRIGLLRKNQDQGTRIIVVEIEGKTVGFIVDSVNEVLRIPKDITEPPPAMSVKMDSDYITGVAKFDGYIVILIDIDKIISGDL